METVQAVLAGSKVGRVVQYLHLIQRRYPLRHGILWQEFRDGRDNRLYAISIIDLFIQDIAMHGWKLFSEDGGRREATYHVHLPRQALPLKSNQDLLHHQ